MIEVHFDGDDVEVLISGEQAEILDASEDCVLAQCSLPDLATEPSQRLPHELRLQLQSEDGFGTYLFHELAARGETPAAFGRRCIPADCVAPPSNIPDILGRRALSSGRLAALGATLDFHHGLLTASAVMVLLLGVCGITAPRAADAGAPELAQALQKKYDG